MEVFLNIFQVPNTHKRMRIKIMHNIGILFVKMGQVTISLRCRTVFKLYKYIFGTSVINSQILT